MPPSDFTSTNNLAVELDFWRSYVPGDVISGRITRKTRLVSPSFQLDVELRGRAKVTLISYGSKNSSSIYRSRYNFFDPKEVSCTLHTGPVHIPPGESQSWNFAITIPTKPNASILALDHDRDTSYLPLDKRSIALQPLPDVFMNYGGSSSTQFGAYVEYNIEANLTFIKEGKKQSIQATHPIIVRTPCSNYFMDNEQFKLSMSHMLFGAHSYHLDDKQTEKLSFKQKWRQSFGYVSVPQHSFNVQTFVPSLLQLGARIPFAVRIVPSDRNTSEEIRDQPFTYSVHSLSVKLVSTTSVICPGTFKPHTKSGEQKYKFRIGYPETMYRPERSLPTLPVGARTEPLDLGGALDLKLERTEVTTTAMPRIRTTFSQPLYPSFKYYNIEHSYKLSWELTVTLDKLGKQFTRNGTQPITILAPTAVQTAECEGNSDELDAFKGELTVFAAALKKGKKGGGSIAGSIVGSNNASMMASASAGFTGGGGGGGGC